MATKQSTFFSHFDRIYCINLDRQKNRWDLAQEEFMKVGIENKIVRFTAFDVPIPHVGCALSQRYIIQQAKSESLKNVLILEDDIEIIPENIKYLPGGLPEEWSLLYGSGLCCWQDAPYVQFHSQGWYTGCGISSGHFVAYNENIYDIFLTSIPNNLESMIEFVNKYKAFDSFLSKYMQELNSTFILAYPICTQASGFSDNEKKYVDRSSKILKRFERIKSLPAIYVYSIRLLRPTLRIIWRGAAFLRGIINSSLNR